jgi:hypothetical protein
LLALFEIRFDLQTAEQRSQNAQTTTTAKKERR